MDLVFLGVNDVGLKIYEWLCQRSNVTVNALITTEEQLELIPRLEPELVISVGYDHLVPAEILSVPDRGSLNLHPSLLPYNRGKSPNVWTIVKGTPAGVTLHFMDKSFDTGRIVAQKRVETDFADTGKDLHNRLERAQFDLFVDTWPSIEDGDFEVTPQSETVGEYHSTEDFIELCRLDPDETYRVKDLLDVLRALTFPPFNNAKLSLDGTTYYIDINITPETKISDQPRDGLLRSYDGD